MTVIEAAFFDGRSAVKHDVQVVLTDEMARVCLVGGETLTEWPRAATREIDPVSGGGEGMLGCSAYPEARIVVEGRENWSALHNWLPNANVVKPWRFRGFALAATAAIAALGLLFFGMSALAPSIAQAIPDSWDKALGRVALAQVASIFAEGQNEKAFCSSENGNRVLTELVSRLIKPGGQEVLDVKVMRSPVVNALAIPGNQIVLMEGLLRQAESLEEVAGVLAHEIGHVQRRHPTASIIEHYGLSMVADYLFGGGMVTALTAMLTEMSYSRDAEAEADRIALEILDKAGVSSKGMATFFERMAKKENNGMRILEFLSTHPMSAKRLEKIEDEQKRLELSLPKADLRILQAICK